MYQTHLRQDLSRLGHPDTDPRHVEGAMRSTRGTLDHLCWQRRSRNRLREKLLDPYHAGPRSWQFLQVLKVLARF